jgi:hypothetical protein
MYQSLATALIELASQLQAASLRVPISQLSLMAGLLFAAGCSLLKNVPFNTYER